jgi:hypothetical protein
MDKGNPSKERKIIALINQFLQPFKSVASDRLGIRQKEPDPAVFIIFVLRKFLFNNCGR